MELDREEEGFEFFCTIHHRYSATPMRALMPLDRIKKGSDSGFHSCYGEFDKAYLPPRQQRIFSFISDKWDNLNPSLNNRENKTNLFQRPSDLESLMPTHPKAVHLITYQNGIRNSPEDFKKMGEAVSAVATGVFGHQPLCIGFYNPTTRTVTLDTARALLRYLGTINLYIIHTAIWFETLLTLLRRNPQLRWLHITHSEGGAIAYLALKMILFRQQTNRIPNHNIASHLILSAFGPLHPIPETLVPRSFNIYNCQDKTTLRFGVKFKDPKTEAVLRPGYDNIRIAHSEEVYKTPFPPGDHSFLGETYKGLLEGNLEHIREYLL